MSEQNQHSEALFDTLSKNKKKRRHRVIRTVLIVIAVIAVILVGLVFYLRQKVERRFAGNEAEVLRYEVVTGTIHTVVSGSGALAQVDVEDITVPVGVEITEVLVENRDAVSKGDILATVDMATVMTTLADVQEQLDEAQLLPNKGGRFFRRRVHAQEAQLSIALVGVHRIGRDAEALHPLLQRVLIMRIEHQRHAGQLEVFLHVFQFQHRQSFQ